MKRRHFLRKTAATTLLTTAAGSAVLSRAQAAPNDRINIGVIGVGKQAVYLMGRAMNLPQTQIVAVCDVVGARLENGAKVANDFYGKLNNKPDYDGTTQYKDNFEELLAHEGLDAVIIATPDHWHALPAVAAANAKKDIYCEKPISHTVVEGRAMVEAARKNKVVFQTGSMQRSEYDGKFRIACELVRNGRIGQVISVNIGIGDPCMPCDLPAEKAPDDTNWEKWQGPAPERAFHHELCPVGVHTHFPAWRRYCEYAGGSVADFGAHHYDIAQWGLGTDDTGPVKIIPPTDSKAKRGLKLVYANGIEMIHGGPGGTTFVGTSGIVAVDRGRLDTVPADLREKNPITEKDTKLENTGGRSGVSHMANWIKRIEDRGDPICHAEIGHRTATLCHLTNIGYQLGRPLEWDPKAEKFVGDEEANGKLHYEYRGDWKLG